MVNALSALVLGFLGGCIPLVVGYFRRRERRLDRLRSVLQGIQQAVADRPKHASDNDKRQRDTMQQLEEELKLARIEASSLLTERHREKIKTVEELVGHGFHSERDVSTDGVREMSQEALDSLSRF